MEPLPNNKQNRKKDEYSGKKKKENTQHTCKTRCKKAAVISKAIFGFHFAAM